MIHRPRSFGAAAVVLALLALTGCTARPATAPAVGATAQPASVQRFACPTGAEVAALTAVPFSALTAASTVCTYGTASDADVQASLTVTHLTTSSRTTLTALRAAATRRGATTADVSGLTFDSFATATRTTCTVWFPASDGVLTSVASSRTGATGSASCGTATAVATLIGAGTPTPAAPTVAVLASRSLAGTRTATATWPWRIGAGTRVRVDRLTASDSLRPSAAGSFAAVAATVPADARAVVLVSGTAAAGESRLAVLTSTTAALSAAAGRAPKATLIVVGPVADATTSYDDRTALAGDLQAAARIAGARYIDPADLGASAGPAGLAVVADGIRAELQQAGVAAS